MHKRNRAVFKTIRGIEHKLCTGPLHREGKFVKITDFWLRGNGRLRPQCKACEVSYLNSEPLVPMQRIRFALDECIFRIGKAETARRLGVKGTRISEWIRKPPNHQKFIKRRFARALITLLHELRRDEIARHRDSIRHGSAVRGRKEKTPKGKHDFNGVNETANALRRANRQRSRLTQAA